MTDDTNWSRRDSLKGMLATGAVIGGVGTVVGFDPDDETASSDDDTFDEIVFRGCSSVFVVFESEDSLPAPATIRVFNEATAAIETVDVTITADTVRRVPGQFGQRPVYEFDVHQFFERPDSSDDKILGVTVGSETVSNTNRCAENVPDDGNEDDDTDDGNGDDNGDDGNGGDGNGDDGNGDDGNDTGDDGDGDDGNDTGDDGDGDDGNDTGDDGDGDDNDGNDNNRDDNDENEDDNGDNGNGNDGSDTDGDGDGDDGDDNDADGDENDDGGKKDDHIDAGELDLVSVCYRDGPKKKDGNKIDLEGKFRIDNHSKTTKTVSWTADVGSQSDTIDIPAKESATFWVGLGDEDTATVTLHFEGKQIDETAANTEKRCR